MNKNELIQEMEKMLNYHLLIMLGQNGDLILEKILLN
jgi:hypothetical protein